jgi:hypothetical protein
MAGTEVAQTVLVQDFSSPAKSWYFQVQEFLLPENVEVAKSWSFKVYSSNNG